jgi:hypothetical protein
MNPPETEKTVDTPKLSLVPTIRPNDSEGLIELLEDLLVDAKEGNIRAFTCAVVRFDTTNIDNKSVFTCIKETERMSCVYMLGVCSYLTDCVKDYFDGNTRVVEQPYRNEYQLETTPESPTES